MIELHLVLDNLKDKGNTLFKFKVIKNLNVVKSYIDPLTSIEKANNDIIKNFSKEKNVLIIKYGKKDNNGGYYIDLSGDITKYKDKLVELFKKYEQEISSYSKATKEYKNLLEEDIQERVILCNLSLYELEDLDITHNQLETLIKFNLIEE